MSEGGKRVFSLPEKIINDCPWCTCECVKHLDAPITLLCHNRREKKSAAIYFQFS